VQAIYLRGKNHLELHQFDVVLFVFHFRFKMLNLRFFSESQDEELQLEAEFELSLSQLPDQSFLPLDLILSHERSKEEVGPFRPPKQPRMEQHWHGNLQPDVRALVILLQVGCI